MEQLLDSYEAGLVAGDIEFAAHSLLFYSGLAMWGCGENLCKLEENLWVYAKRMIQFNQTYAGKGIIVYLQQVLELVGSNDVAYLSLCNSSEEEFFQEAHQNKQRYICRMICLKRKYLSLFKGDMSTAEKMFQLGLSYPIDSIRTVTTITCDFVDGLIALFFARKHDEHEHRWTKIGEDSISKMKQWSSSSDWNFSNKLYLLEAEYCFLKGDDTLALEKYNASIKAAHGHRFVHEEGLAFDKLASFHLTNGRRNDALSNLAQAKKCYKIWGALHLVAQLDIAMVLCMQS